MSKKEQKKQENIRKCLELYVVELRENLNVRLICETEEESPIQEQMLWIEDITLTEVACQQKKKRFVPGEIIAVWKQRIKTWFHHCIFPKHRIKKGNTT